MVRMQIVHEHRGPAGETSFIKSDVSDNRPERLGVGNSFQSFL